ncbi:hypothetical protein MTO96_018120 [Rhipicephalus appendiculatus]
MGDAGISYHHSCYFARMRRQAWPDGHELRVPSSPNLLYLVCLKVTMAILGELPRVPEERVTPSNAPNIADFHSCPQTVTTLGLSCLLIT